MREYSHTPSRLRDTLDALLMASRLWRRVSGRVQARIRSRARALYSPSPLPRAQQSHAATADGRRRDVRDGHFVDKAEYSSNMANKSASSLLHIHTAVCSGQSHVAYSHMYYDVNWPATLLTATRLTSDSGGVFERGAASEKARSSKLIAPLALAACSTGPRYKQQTTERSMASLLMYGRRGRVFI